MSTASSIPFFKPFILWIKYLLALSCPHPTFQQLCHALRGVLWRELKRKCDYPTTCKVCISTTHPVITLLSTVLLVM
uniref:Putative secreted protein n=1 Tax=Anopheles marajoara TaxID=58244 RepID=A0A2M4CDL5_9DIPT